MNQTRLFIEGQEVELDNSVQFAITKQFEDILNPTSIINTWSKTVAIPFTQSNNKLFGHIYNPSRLIMGTSGVIGVGGTTYTGSGAVGIYFDPLRKLNFRLEWNGDTIMTGYAKLNDIKRNGKKSTYNLTLFGELGKIFQELKKITFNINDENSDYIIDGSQYVDSAINKSLVVSSWNSTGQTHSSLSDSTITDIIGFAPNNSYYDEFDPKSFQLGVEKAMTFVDVLKEKWDDGNGGYVTGIEPQTAIPDGMLPRDIGEFRSYYQTPFIYWNKLWQIFQAKAEQTTGYTWDLDSEWFNINNPYWYKLVYMLKPFNVKNGTSLENYYTKWGRTSALDRSLGRSRTPGSPATVLKMAMPSGWDTVPTIKNEASKLLMTYGDAGSPEYDTDYPHYPTDVAVFRCPDEFTSIAFKWTFQLLIETPGSCHFKDTAGLIVSVRMWGCDDWRTPTANARLIQTNNYIVRHEGSGYTYSNYTPIDTGTSPDSGSARYKLYPTFNSGFTASSTKCGPYCYFTIEASYTETEPFYRENMGDLGSVYLQQATTCTAVLSSGAFRSGTNFTLNDLWDNNFNIFEQILNYCKMYRIMVIADNVEKKLKFIPFVTYFGDYYVTDWTDKVDMSKEFTINPVTFEDKYVIFNYADNESKLGKRYKEAWGLDYGEKKLITQYNFNEEERDLFSSEITSSITNTDFSLSWGNIYDRNVISYSLPAEIFPYAKDDDGKFIGNFGAFFFHNGKRNFDTTASLHMRGVSISDDTNFQQAYDTYYYSQSQDGTSVTTYPALDIVSSDGEKLCIFNKPMENYTYAKNLNTTKGIYDMFWSMYINERYNIQNKKVTCYIKLSPLDFSSFEQKNFVTIDNVLYIVNKIYDYDITSSNPTKVDLITVQNLTAYYVDYYTDYLNVSPDTINIDGASGTQDITVNAYHNGWNFEILDSNGNSVSNPQGVTVSKINDTTLRVTKTSDIQLNYIIRFYTVTRSTTVSVTGARSPYFRFYPATITARKNHSDEFDILIETNFEQFSLLASNTVQWYNGSVWKNTAFTASSSTVPGWASGDSTTYNEAHEDRTANLHIKIVNPTANGNVTFFDRMGEGIQYFYLPYTAIETNVLTIDPEEYSLNYHGGTFGVTGTSSSAWSWTYPQGVSMYGGSSGEAGEISSTFNVQYGQPNTTLTCTVTNTEGISKSLYIHLTTS